MDVKVVSPRAVAKSRRMPRWQRIAILLATCWPLLYFGIFLVYWLRLVFTIMSPAGSVSSFGFPVALIVGHLATMLISVALLAFYIVHLFRNARIDGNMKAVWAIVIFMGGQLAMPVYWYLYIWRDAAADGAVTAAAGQHHEATVVQ